MSLVRVGESIATAIIFTAAGVALLFAVLQVYIISRTPLRSAALRSPSDRGFDEAESSPLFLHTTREETAKLTEIHSAIEVGAAAFLHEEYSICLIFLTIFAFILFALITWAESLVSAGGFTAIAFVLGALTSILSGYVGMRIAVYSNVRTAINAQKAGYKYCFNTAFRAGSVVGFSLTGFGILVLYTAMLLYRFYYTAADEWTGLTNAIAGYGLGGSVIALYGRVGGGIYTKAADVGADLVGKVVHNIPEDDPRNPAVIADLVGDNVGDIAGMGSDLFGSFAESTCAALVIAAQSYDLRAAGWGAVTFPVTISAAGCLVCCLVAMIPSVFIDPVHRQQDIDLALRLQIILSAAIMIPVTFGIANAFLPEKFLIVGTGLPTVMTSMRAATCVVMGIVGGVLNGLFTEYFTSYSFSPVQELAHAATTGPATEIIHGLALGYRSVVPPVLVLGIIVYVSFHLGDLYGIALAAVGMLSTLAACLTIDGFGPIADNAGGIAEMAHLAPEVRVKTDALDSAGNTTAAIGKGFAIGSAALVSLALMSAFVTRVRVKEMQDHGTNGTNFLQPQILEPLTFASMLIGACLPYWFSAMTMRSVGDAAMQMIREVERQYAVDPSLLLPNSLSRPDYARCVAISTRASLREMIAPGALVILSPLIVGTFFGVYAVVGLLTGSLLSSVQLAISMSNCGGAWDNAKKMVAASDPASALGGKGSDVYKASVICDTVGDPMKDTSGPSLNILMKLMAIISLVFAEFFYAINRGQGLTKIPIN